MAVEPLWDIDRITGELIRGWQRCKQSIFTILTTRLRTRLMRLWFGSSFMDLQDKPASQEAIFRSLIAAADAVNSYEPEFKVTSVIIDEIGPDGLIVITMNGDYLPDSAARRLQLEI